MLNFDRKEMSILLKERRVTLRLYCWIFTSFQVPQFFGISFIIIFKFSEDKNTFGLRFCDNRSVAMIWFGVIIIYVALKRDLKGYLKMLCTIIRLFSLVPMHKAFANMEV